MNDASKSYLLVFISPIFYSIGLLLYRDAIAENVITLSRNIFYAWGAMMFSYILLKIFGLIVLHRPFFETLLPPQYFVYNGRIDLILIAFIFLSALFWGLAMGNFSV